MLKQEVWDWVADTFGCSVGMATIVEIHSRDSEEGKERVKKYSRFEDELGINEIITESIEEGRYRKLQRELYRLGKKGFSPKIKEVTIYKRAWKEATNRNDSKKGNNEQSSKV
jgi:hypothetical protein